MRVSLITPTYNRREFWSRCVRYFQYQDHPDMEWVILDNGPDSIVDLLPNDSRIRYFSIPEPKRTHGELMNIGFAHATGEIGIVWDDDDFYALDRVSRQVAPFSDPNILVTGTSCIYYYLHGTQQAYRYHNWTNINWLAAIALRKSVWENSPFKPLPFGADTHMLKGIPKENQKDLNDLTLLVASIHPQNASAKNLPNASFIETSWSTIQKITGDALSESV